MAKILLVDNDRGMLKTMAEYLSWHGLDTLPLDDSRQAMSRLAGGGYGLLICSAFAEPMDGYSLCRAIRKSDKPELRRVEVILIAPEEPEPAARLLLQKLGAYYMNKYESAGVWHGKITAILNNPNGDRSLPE